MEIWRDIDGYNGLYQISSLGRVKSVSRKGTKGDFIKPSVDRYGYLRVIFSKNNIQQTYQIHRLVASAFIDNPDNLPQVNHINEDKTDNSVENLEWCSSKYNSNYGSRNMKISKALKNNTKIQKPIYSTNITTNEIIYYQSITNASEITGIKKSAICNCLKKMSSTSGGYKWNYVN